jgi:hypothetical protein
MPSIHHAVDPLVSLTIFSNVKYSTCSFKCLNVSTNVLMNGIIISLIEGWALSIQKKPNSYCLCRDKAPLTQNMYFPAKNKL